MTNITDNLSAKDQDEMLVLRKITGRKRNIDTVIMKNHFVKYFQKRLLDTRLQELNEAIIDFDNCNFNKLSYTLLSAPEYSNWCKAWSSYKLRNSGEAKYRYYISQSTNNLIKQVSDMPEFKNLSVDKIISKLIMLHIIDK
ncbi:hypothetical protein C9J21_17930 [Photobacterium phosphoreum]|uniref:hypothetical protein n=1 Tax=Photobacterium phosphoreum TaxID=659 RepID=UPI000D17A74B|nr:hypothetical protein [Photobacterium phosphoreum]PSW31229.1 hypothetical protein C9J21_17930 [Photobacterium phosphoreum]